MNSSAKKKFKSAVSLVLVAALIVTGLYAFLFSKNEKRNKFTIGNVDIKLHESFMDVEDSIAYDPIITNLVANQKITKAPWIENTGSNPAFVYMSVGIPVQEVLLEGRTYPIETELLTLLYNSGTEQAPVYEPGINDGWAIIPNRDGTLFTEVEKDGQKYHYYNYAYNTELAPSDTTPKLFDKVQYVNAKNEMYSHGINYIYDNASAFADAVPYFLLENTPVPEFTNGWNDAYKSVFQFLQFASPLVQDDPTLTVQEVGQQFSSKRGEYELRGANVDLISSITSTDIEIKNSELFYSAFDQMLFHLSKDFLKSLTADQIRTICESTFKVGNKSTNYQKVFNANLYPWNYNGTAFLNAFENDVDSAVETYYDYVFGDVGNPAVNKEYYIPHEVLDTLSASTLNALLDYNINNYGSIYAGGAGLTNTAYLKSALSNYPPNETSQLKDITMERITPQAMFAACYNYLAKDAAFKEQDDALRIFADTIQSVVQTKAQTSSHEGQLNMIYPDESLSEILNNLNNYPEFKAEYENTDSYVRKFVDYIQEYYQVISTGINSSYTNSGVSALPTINVSNDNLYSEYAYEYRGPVLTQNEFASAMPILSSVGPQARSASYYTNQTYEMFFRNMIGSAYLSESNVAGTPQVGSLYAFDQLIGAQGWFMDGIEGLIGVIPILQNDNTDATVKTIIGPQSTLMPASRVHSKIADELGTDNFDVYCIFTRAGYTPMYLNLRETATACTPSLAPGLYFFTPYMDSSYNITSLFNTSFAAKTQSGLNVTQYDIPDEVKMPIDAYAIQANNYENVVQTLTKNKDIPRTSTPKTIVMPYTSDKYMVLNLYSETIPTGDIIPVGTIDGIDIGDNYRQVSDGIRAYYTYGDYGNYGSTLAMFYEMPSPETIEVSNEEWIQMAPQELPYSTEGIKWYDSNGNETTDINNTVKIVYTASEGIYEYLYDASSEIITINVYYPDYNGNYVTTGIYVVDKIIEPKEVVYITLKCPHCNHSQTLDANDDDATMNAINAWNIDPSNENSSATCPSCGQNSTLQEIMASQEITEVFDVNNGLYHTLYDMDITSLQNQFDVEVSSRQEQTLTPEEAWQLYVGQEGLDYLN